VTANPIIYKPKGAAAEYAHLACNHYVGCTHRCTYCYVPACLRIVPARFWAGVSPKKNALARVRADAARLAGTSERVLLSFASDPYPAIDGRLGLTRSVLSVLKEHDIPFAVLTKSGHVAERDFDLYGPRDTFGVTITSMNAERASIIEPGAAPPWDRANSLVEAKKRGLNTWLSLEPVIVPAEALTVIKSVHQFVDVIKIGPLNHARCDLAAEQWAEFTRRAINLCTASSTRYFIKSALAARLGRFAFDFNSYDDRKIERSADERQISKQSSLW